MCFASFIHDVEDTARVRKRINVGRRVIANQQMLTQLTMTKESHIHCFLFQE